MNAVSPAAEATATGLGISEHHVGSVGADDVFETSEPINRITQFAIFRARCEARALLFAAGELDLHTALDVLQTDAASGLVLEVGQDAVQAEMARAFADLPRHVEWVPDAEVDADDAEDDWYLPDISPQRDYRPVCVDGVASAGELQRDYEAALRRERAQHGPANSTRDAFLYLVRLGDLARLKGWLSRRSSEERAQLFSLLELQQCR